LRSAVGLSPTRQIVFASGFFVFIPFLVFEQVFCPVRNVLLSGLSRLQVVAAAAME
jgi:hypothetical protein